MLIDTHAHINYFKDPKRVIEEALKENVKKIILPGVRPHEFDSIVELIDKYDCVYGALGVHPSEAKEYNGDTKKRMLELLKHPKIVAIGEIGLDYYWDKENKEEQKKVFINQLEIATLLDLPVIIHDREAHLDTFEIIKKSGHKKILMHCYSGSAEFAKMCLKEGFLIAIGGVVTFKNAKKLKETVKGLSLESLVLETDCPYLAPHPFRGEENAPKYLNFIAKEIANIKDITYDEVVEKTGENALKFFNIKGEEE